MGHRRQGLGITVSPALLPMFDEFDIYFLSLAGIGPVACLPAVEQQRGRGSMADKERKVEASKESAAPVASTPVSSPIRRRTLLAAIATGGAVASSELPGRWSRPMIDAVMLPAHAQTSPTDDSTCTATVAIFDFWLLGGSSTVTAPFTGSIGEIPPSTVTPTGSTGTVRWFYSFTAISGTGTVSGDSNSCQTVSRGASAYTIPLLVGDACFVEPD